MWITKKGSARRNVAAFVLGALTCFCMNYIIAKNSDKAQQRQSKQACLYASEIVELSDILWVGDDIYIQCVLSDRGGIFKTVVVHDADEITAEADRKQKENFGLAGNEDS